MPRPYLLINSKKEDDKPIAIVRGGKRDGDIIYLRDAKDDEKSDSDNEELDERLTYMVEDIIQKHLNKNKDGTTARQRFKNAETLKRLFKKNGYAKDKRLREILHAVKAEFKDKKDQHIFIPDGNVEMIPDCSTRQCCYTAAPSGSGKSYWTMKYAKQYNRLFPKNKVYLISKVQGDESLKGIKNLIRIPIDDSILDEEFEAEDFADSLVIADDIDTVNDKEIREAIDHITNDILETGRHCNVYLLKTSHLISNYKQTRTVLNESHCITVFPNSGSFAQITHVFKNYFGLSNNEIKKIKKLHSRHVSLLKNYPMMLLYDRGVMLCADLDDDED
jgi:hypothetical protein